MQKTKNSLLKMSLINNLSIILATGVMTWAVSMPVRADDIHLAPPPNLAAKAYLLKDFNSDYVIASEKSDMRVEPASLTKIMTAYLSFKALKNAHLSLTQTLPVSEAAWRTEGSKMFIEPNQPVTVDALLHGMITQSGNDASIALAEGIAGTEAQFADMMNKEALKLGMKNTHYMNATGLPDANHYTTANDLMILAKALIHDFPDQYQRLYALKEYTYNKITQPNRNRLLWLDASVDGMKTGHTESAGYCLISSAKRDGTRRIAVLLGAATDAARATESQKLLNYGFQYFETKFVYPHGKIISQPTVWKGAENSIAATVDEDLFVTLPKGQYAHVKAIVVNTPPLIAPIAKGQVIGSIQFTLNGDVIETRPLVASKAIASASFFGRLWDSVRLLLQ